MSHPTHAQVQKLQALGKEPIMIPADMYFSGNEKMQRTPGAHHRKEFQKTGTYNHPLLVANRKRIAMDRAKRLINGKMSEVEHRKIGGIQGVIDGLKEHGYTLNEEQTEVANMNAESLRLSGEMKLEERESTLKASGREKIREEPVNPSEDIIKMAIAAKTTKLKSADEDLSSGLEEGEKEKSFRQVNPDIEVELESI